MAQTAEFIANAPDSLEMSVGGAIITMPINSEDGRVKLSDKGNVWWKALASISATPFRPVLGTDGDGNPILGAFDAKILGGVVATCLGKQLKMAESGVHLSTGKVERATGRVRAGTGGNPTCQQGASVDINGETYRVKLQLTYIAKKDEIVISATAIPQGQAKAKEPVGSISGSIFG